MREALLLCCMITVKCIPSLILVICFLGPTVRNPVDGLQCLPLTSWTSCWWRTEWNTIKVYSLAKVLTLGLVKQQISIWTNTKAFIFQSLQSVCAKQFGGSSPQGATGDRQGKSSTGNHFRQVGWLLSTEGRYEFKLTLCYYIIFYFLCYVEVLLYLTFFWFMQVSWRFKPRRTWTVQCNGVM